MSERTKNSNFISQKKIAGIYILAILSFVVLLAIDQVSKYWINANLELYHSIPIIEDVFEIHYIHNYGAAFGLFQNKQIVFVIFTIIALVLGSFYFNRCVQTGKFKALQISIVLILAGAVGNLIDRLLYQYVIDFLYFKLIDFPVFNIADCYVTVGFFLAVILILFVYKDEDLEALFPKKE